MLVWNNLDLLGGSLEKFNTQEWRSHNFLLSYILMEETFNSLLYNNGTIY